MEENKAKTDESYNVLNRFVATIGRFNICLDTVERNDTAYPYSFINAKDCVGILAFSEGKIILINQYRHSYGQYEIEIPGGSIESGEVPEDVAKRELLEETGYKVLTIKSLGEYYPSPGSMHETCHLFVAECVKTDEPNREPLEFINNVLVTKYEMIEMISSGRFKHSMGLVAWLKYTMMGEV